MTDKSCWDHRKWCIGGWVSAAILILASMACLLWKVVEVDKLASTNKTRSEEQYQHLTNSLNEVKTTVGSIDTSLRHLRLRDLRGANNSTEVNP